MSGFNSHAVFVTANYPTPLAPGYGTFVQQLVWSMARQGCDCSVIQPIRYWARRSGPLPPVCTEENIDGQAIRVLRPRMLSCGVKHVAGFNTGRLTQFFFERATARATKWLKRPPCFCYGHFLYPGGAGALRAAQPFGVPAFVAVGEGTFWTVTPMGYARARRQLVNLTGFIAVSSVIREMLMDELQIPNSKIGVFPNGVDFHVFHPRCREEMCAKYKFPADTFNICFVGNFDELKGVARLVEAVRGLNNVRLILVGRGSVAVTSPQIVFQAVVPHAVVPELINAADLFVLPTCEEGSCNAVIEALACGVPVLTSNGRYMDDIINEHVAVRVDPLNVSALRAAIIGLMNDPERRRRLSAASLEHVRQFDIRNRAQKIQAWIRQKMVGYILE